jgi:hypothetical protein
MEIKYNKQIRKGNYIINFVAQKVSDEQIDKIHETIARLLLKNYHKKQKEFNKHEKEK